jgi:hypothetical protein
MANLQNTTVNGSLSATNYIASPALYATATSQKFTEYTGTAFIPSSFNNSTNFVDLFANTGLYERMYGSLVWWVNQSQFHSGSLYFQLSQYGLNVTTTSDTSGYFSVSLFNPSFGTNYLRFTNTVGTVWGNGTYYFSVRVSGLGGQTFFSNYLTNRVR